MVLSGAVSHGVSVYCARSIHPDQSLLGFVLLRATPSTMFESIKVHKRVCACVRAIDVVAS